MRYYITEDRSGFDGGTPNPGSRHVYTLRAMILELAALNDRDVSTISSLDVDDEYSTNMLSLWVKRVA